MTRPRGLQWDGKDIFLHANDFWNASGCPLELFDGPVIFRVGSRKGKVVAVDATPLVP